MGLIKVMITAIIFLIIIGGTLMITRWGMEKFIDIFLGKESK
jgi:hypothetical protein